MPAQAKSDGVDGYLLEIEGHSCGDAIRVGGDTVNVNPHVVLRIRISGSANFSHNVSDILVA